MNYWRDIHSFASYLPHGRFSYVVDRCSHLVYLPFYVIFQMFQEFMWIWWIKRENCVYWKTCTHCFFPFKIIYLHIILGITIGHNHWPFSNWYCILSIVSTSALPCKCYKKSEIQLYHLYTFGKIFYYYYSLLTQSLPRVLLSLISVWGPKYTKHKMCSTGLYLKRTVQL